MDESEELLRRALLDEDEAASVALRVRPLSTVDDGVTVIFHGRRDLGTVQTYVANGRLGAGMAVTASQLLRVPVDLDLGDAEDRSEAEELYAEQARALRDAIVAADTVLAVWHEPLGQVTGGGVTIDRSVQLELELPAHRLMPVALRAPERGITVAPVCGARTLAEGRPPVGIACAQQELTRVYPLAQDPEACLEDFLTAAAGHAREMAERLERAEHSVQRFLEINEDPPPAA